MSKQAKGRYWRGRRALAWVALIACALSCNHRSADGPTSEPSSRGPTTTSPVAGTTSATAAAPSAPPTTAAPDASAAPSPVALTLGPDGARFGSSIDAAIRGVVQNQGQEPVVLDMCVLSSPILSLVFHDASGKRLLTIPPGMPPTEQERAKCQVTLNPGEKRTVTYGLHIFSPELAAGTYTVRSSALRSNTISITITGR